MQTTFIILSSIFITISYIIYIWAMVVGKAKPHRTTRFVLSILTIIGTASLFAQHDRVAFWFLALSAVFCFIAFILSFNYGMGGWAKTDIVCLIIAMVGIVTWKLTSDPVLGLYATIAADLAGMIPALIKTYHLPHTEYWLSYVFDVSAAGFTLLAIEKWTLQGFSYPLYIFIINSIMLALILRPILARQMSSILVE